MKRSYRITAAILAVVLLAASPACILRSVQPWLEKSIVVFDDDLLGGWVGKDGNGDVAMTFLRDPEHSDAYIVQYASKDGQGTFVARLGKSGADHYLEFRPKEGAPGIDGLLLYRSWSAAWLDISPERLVVRTLNYEAVKNAAKLDRLGEVKCVWDEDNELVFVSKTEELQRFLLSLGRDSELWAPPIRLTRKK